MTALRDEGAGDDGGARPDDAPRGAGRAGAPGLREDEARALFDAAIDEELSNEGRAAFEAALSRNDALRAEFEDYREVIEGARALGRDAPAVDLLEGVQHKLRARSGGRFYRDRFASRRDRGGVTWLLAIAACFVMVVLVWLAYDAGLLAGARER